MSRAKSTVDWQRIQIEYCAGEDSISEIADRHGISRAAIQKRAKVEKWQRAVAPRNPLQPTRQPPPPPPPPSDTEKPLDAAETAERGRALVARMLDELDVITSRRGELEDMIVAATEGDQNGDRRTGMMRAVDLPTRANTLKTIALAFKTINEASAPQGKKAAQQDRANEVASRFRGVGPPTLKAVK